MRRFIIRTKRFASFLSPNIAKSMNSPKDTTPQLITTDPDAEDEYAQASSDSFKVQAKEKSDASSISDEGKETEKDASAETSNVSLEEPKAREVDEEGSDSSAKERHSSLELRRLPVSAFLMPDVDIETAEQDALEEEQPRKRGFLRMTCLNPKFDLRTQLMLAFDSVIFATIFIVVLICVVVSLKTGENIKDINSSTFQTLAEQIQGRTARYLAESLEHRLMPKDVVQILYEVTRDRFQGFPTFLDDSQVPFKNMDTNTSVYPIVGGPLPLDWEIQNPVTEEMDEEYVQGRRRWYGVNPLSTASGAFIMQGACDPSETDSSARTYWPNCTDASNDIRTGGVMRPSNLTGIIHEKARDLVPVMKALYEYNQDIREIGIYFANNGVGATVSFPHFELDAQNTYSSTGCEWLKEPNPYDSSRSIGTQDQIDQCYEEGTVLSARQYNPLGRAWCREQALHPEKVLVEGPFLGAWESNWLISSGRSVYSAGTNEFLACIFVGMSTTFAEDIMRESRVTPHSEVSVIRWDPEGSVVASSAWSLSEVRGISELRLGMTNESYSTLYSLVDYDAQWEPIEVQEAYQSFTSRGDGFIAAAYPIPPVPEEYDASYRPVFFTVTSTDEADVFDAVDDVNEDVDQRADQAILFSVCAGSAGFVLATIIILVAATAMTKPLQLMNKDAKLIVGSFGEDGSSNVQQIKPIVISYPRCVPNTEITDLITEFNKMTSSFSGSLLARSEGEKYVEVKNIFDLRNEKVIMDIYKSREQTDLIRAGESSSNVDVVSSTGVSSRTASKLDEFVHTGTNINIERPIARRYISSKDLRLTSGKQTASPLFVWIVVLIVTPLLLTTITISAVVLSAMSREFNETIKDAEAHFLDVAVYALSVYVRLRASFVSTYTSRSVRDLYLMTRLGSWILFDGLERADSYTEVVTAVNECLEAKSPDTCPWAIENRVCDCSWNEDSECEDYPEDLSRRLQIPYFFVSSDALLPNGTRLSTDFPNNSVSPSTTLWWGSPYELPGSESNQSAFGYATSYDRMRVISAFPLFPVLVNYDIQNENSIGRFFAFEEDGLFVAYEGCDNALHSYAAFWKSTVNNGASLLRPELCPLDKYGFDPRCREWYDTGRKNALQKGDPLYITSPYVFASETSTAQSATSPLIDPRTGYYVGQVLLDFSLTDVFNVLTSSSTPLSKGGFPLLITIGTDTFGGDTVIGPGFNGSVSSLPVMQVVIPFDQDCEGDEKCTHRKRAFENVVSLMKAGNSSTAKLERTTADGGTESTYLSFAPISVKYLDPADESDFTRGALVGEHLTYSLGLVETEEGILEPFLEIEENMQRQISAAVGILSAVIVLAVIATVGISYVVARSISEAMACLLELIRLLNRNDVSQDPPVIDQTTGSKEILNVSNTMESLYRVVRLANLSFYAGDLEAAYRILVDALRLFKRLDNEKAVGVASNNLGNTLLAMYRAMQMENSMFKYGVTRQEIIAKGHVCFQEAIRLGEQAYDTFFDKEGWSPNCLDFMQYLSNRYFNRAIFLLTVKNDHQCPEKIESLGFRDLDIARDMDAEIEAQGVESGWGSVNRLEKLFNLNLVRVRGRLLLLEMGYSDKWDIDESLQELFRMVSTEAKKPSSDLFNEMSYIGRLQQAECELMKHLVIKGDVATAAKIAVRMLVEDEHILFDAAATAIKVLLAYVVNSTDSGPDGMSRPHLKELLEDILDDLSEYDESRRTSVASTRTHSIASRSLRNINDRGRNRALSTKWPVYDNSGHFVIMEQF